MERNVDLRTASQDVLIDVITRLQAANALLEKRIAQLEGPAKSRNSRRMPGLKLKEEGKPAQVTEHVYTARACPRRQRRCTPKAQLNGVAAGKQRMGVNVLSLIAALREEARLPVRTIQWHLETVPGLRLSLGAVVNATRKVAGNAQRELAGILERIRGSPVVHSDATGWRQDGVNGYVWTFSAPTERYFLRRGRDQAVVDEVLGEEFAGALVRDCDAACHHCDGPQQRCWAHRLRDIHDRCVLHPRDRPLARWAEAVNCLYRQAADFTHPSEKQRPEKQRRTARLALERRRLALCQPYRDAP